jgi:porphobilinogen deaminase
MSVTGMVANLDGSVRLQDTVSGPFASVDNAIALGTELAGRLLAQGSEEILEQIRSQSSLKPEPLP